MRIKQMLCTLLISIGIANADELDSLYMNYISAGGKITPEISEILKKDIYYQKALEEMKNPKDTKNEIKDPEALRMLQLNIKNIDWNVVYNNLILSNKEYKNPISSFYGVYIINKYMGQVNKIEDYRNFSETLYEKEKDMCQSYLNYGAIFEKGFGSPINYTKAISIYEEGLKKTCKDGWQKQVIESKLLSLKKKY